MVAEMISIENYPSSVKEFSKEYPCFTVAETMWDYMNLAYDKLQHLTVDLKDSFRTNLYKGRAVSYEIHSIKKEDKDILEFDHLNIVIYVHGLNVHGLNNKWISFGIDRDQQIRTSPYLVEFATPFAPLISNIITMELFLQYAEVETKILNSFKQIFEGPNCLYRNKTMFPVTIIDSTWFTTLIHSGAFKVRGHFRLQPCGEGLSKRKLVWIKDFQKNGYTREAKIVSE